MANLLRLVWQAWVEDPASIDQVCEIAVLALCGAFACMLLVLFVAVSNSVREHLGESQSFSSQSTHMIVVMRQSQVFSISHLGVVAESELLVLANCSVFDLFLHQGALSLQLLEQFRFPSLL